jgi:alpha-beta hydrolase superfamily lysophospholipase
VVGVVTVFLLSSIPTLGAGRPVSVPTPDGLVLSGSLYEASSRPAPAVVLVHMLGRSKEEWMPFAERLQSVGITALAIDLRGHGHSQGNATELPMMVGDVQAAIGWLSARPGTQVTGIGMVGASLGANLAAMAAADLPLVRVVALLSPSLDYRGVRLDTSVMRKLDDRRLWLAASTEDPYALRTLRELVGDDTSREQHLSQVRAHGTALIAADQDLARGLVDWLQRSLIF